MMNRAITAGKLMVLGLILAASGSAFALPAALAQPQPPSPSPTATYDQLTARRWALIAKDPEARIGELYVVYGVVTQFDAATGPDVFRADVDGVRHSESYLYPTNTVLSGDASILAEIVTGDSFTAKVEVRGAITYSTQIGGSTTVPHLRVDSIKVTAPPSP